MTLAHRCAIHPCPICFPGRSWRDPIPGTVQYQEGLPFKMDQSRKFEYVALVDAIGTLWTEAAVHFAEAKRDGPDNAADKWDAVLVAMKMAWPDLVTMALGKQL